MVARGAHSYNREEVMEGFTRIRTRSGWACADSVRIHDGVEDCAGQRKQWGVTTDAPGSCGRIARHLTGILPFRSLA